MKRLLLIPLLVLAFGCAHVHLAKTCPATSTGVSFGLKGSVVGNTVLSMIGSAATKAGFLAAAGGATPSEQSTLDYTYLPLFGADAGSIDCPMPVPPTTTIITVPNPPSQPSILK